MPKPGSVPVYNDAEEYKQVRRDLIRVIVLNLILFAVLIGLYLWNRSSGQLDTWFAQILKF